MFRRIPTEYARLTFDKRSSRARRLADEADLPAAELCGPGHPLFDALVDLHRAHRGDLGRGAVLIDPEATEATTLAFARAAT